jgi:CRISPR type III-associated protein (TIGR04423 family)
MKILDKKQIIQYVNEKLKGYEGYIQFLDKKIDMDNDVFINKDPYVNSDDELIYEAHFSNGKTSVCIKLINDKWLLSETDITEIPQDDIEEFYAKSSLKVKMAQIWVTEKDELCANFEVNKLQAVVFAGFEGGKK